MAYDAEYTEGWDKYGPTGYVDFATALAAEWNVTGGTVSVVDALAGTGYAINHNLGSNTEQYSWRSVGDNYARCIGGSYFRCDVNGNTNHHHGWAFRDSGTIQLCININQSGQIEIKRGTLAGGTVIATSTETVLDNSIHCLEWDITFHNSTGIVKIWLDSVLTSINLTGQDTCTTANNYFNEYCGTALHATNGANLNITYDHSYLWLFLASGGSETPALTNPVIETQSGTSDSAVQFTPTAGVLGTAYRIVTTASAPAANSLVLRPYTPEVSATINSVSIIPNATNAVAKYKPVIYSDSAGAPNSLLSTGAETVGTTSGTVKTMSLTTPQALTAGTQYWIGYITDTSVSVQLSDSSLLGYRAANTYASGAPGTAPAMTTGQASFLIYGNTTGMTTNWGQVNENPPLGDKSYNQSSTVGEEDLYDFPALSVTPSIIYTVGVKALVARSDAGARTVDLRTKSGGTSSSGDKSGQAPPTSYGILGSYFKTDPNTGLAWAPTAVNNAKHGIKVAS